MSSAFKDGIDAGLSDFKSYNADLANVSLGKDPEGFSNVVSIAGRAPGFVSKMRSAFERIGENMHDDARSWAEGQRRRLLDDSAGLLTGAENLATRAKGGLDAANQAKGLRDAGDGDEDRKRQLEEAEQRLKEATDALRTQIDVVRGGLNTFYDTLRDVDAQFKKAIAAAKSTVESNQSPVDKLLSDIRAIEDQVNEKIAAQKDMSAQRDSQLRTHGDLSTKLSEKLRAEQDADRALVEGAKKDPPLSAGDLHSLAQASAAARQERERAEADRAAYYTQTMKPTDDAYWAKVAESAPLEQQLSTLKQRRDELLDGLNKSRTALSDFSQEYQEPSL